MKDYSIYKFAIKQILEAKAGVKIPKIKLELMAKLSITRTWLNKIINAKVGSNIKLDHEQLVIISKVLKCSINKLITSQCKDAIIKSIEPDTVKVEAAA